MFDSILQSPSGVLPVQHEFVTIATDFFSTSGIVLQEVAVGQDGLHSAALPIFNLGVSDAQTPPPHGKLVALMTTPTALPTFDFGATEGQTPPPPGKLAALLTTSTALPTFALGMSDSNPLPPPPGKLVATLVTATDSPVYNAGATEGSPLPPPPSK